MEVTVALELQKIITLKLETAVSVVNSEMCCSLMWERRAAVVLGRVEVLKA